MTRSDIGNTLKSRHLIRYPHPGGYAIIGMRDGAEPLGSGSQRHNAAKASRCGTRCGEKPREISPLICTHNATTRFCASHVCVRARMRTCTEEREIYRCAVVDGYQVLDVKEEKPTTVPTTASFAALWVGVSDCDRLEKTHNGAKMGGF